MVWEHDIIRFVRRSARNDGRGPSILTLVGCLDRELAINHVLLPPFARVFIVVNAFSIGKFTVKGDQSQHDNGDGD